MAFKRHHFQPDTPTNNFATFTPFAQRWSQSGRANLSKGNLRVHNPSSTIGFTTISVDRGKWYWEIYMEDDGGYAHSHYRGVHNFQLAQDNHATVAPCFCYNSDSRQICIDSNWTDSDIPKASETDIISFFWDADKGEMTVRVNNVAGTTITGLTTGVPMAPFSANDHNTIDIYNFGQNPDFCGEKTDSAGPYADANGIGKFYYQPPAGALALCTENLPVTPITAHLGEKPGDYFKAVTWTNSTENADVTVPLGFQADLIWWKQRDVANSHRLIDSVRGLTSEIAPNGDNIESIIDPPTRTYNVTAINSDNFTFNGYINSGTRGGSMVAWCWKAGGSAGKYNVDGKAYASAAEAGLNAGDIPITKASINTKAGFGIYQFTGTGATRLAHGLNQQPEVVLVKCTSKDETYWVWAYVKGDENLDIYMNTSNSHSDSGESYFKIDGKDNTIVMGLTTTTYCNKPGLTYILYAWHSVPGYSQIGKFIGTDNIDGPFAYTGFKPAFILTKSNVSGAHWCMHDTTRDPYNPSKNYVWANKSTEEGSEYSKVDFLSNGFKCRNKNDNMNYDTSPTYYMAFAEKPATPASRVTIPKPEIKANDMRSIDFSNNYLTRTAVTPTNEHTFSLSFWIKLNGNGNANIVDSYDGTNNHSRFVLGLRGTQSWKLNVHLQISTYNPSNYTTQTNAFTDETFEDFSKWNHFVLTGSNGVLSIYANGKEANRNDSMNVSYENWWLNQAGRPLTIGRGGDSSEPCNGQLANIHFIDGQALDQNSFGEMVNDVWIPKQYEGTYGNNGYHLDFAPENMEYSGDTITRVLDQSPNSNHWTAH